MNRPAGSLQLIDDALQHGRVRFAVGLLALFPHAHQLADAPAERPSGTRLPRLVGFQNFDHLGRRGDRAAGAVQLAHFAGRVVGAQHQPQAFDFVERGALGGLRVGGVGGLHPQVERRADDVIAVERELGVRRTGRGDGRSDEGERQDERPAQSA